MAASEAVTKIANEVILVFMGYLTKPSRKADILIDAVTVQTVRASGPRFAKNAFETGSEARAGIGH